jgi:hypothetical protein
VFRIVVDIRRMKRKPKLQELLMKFQGTEQTKEEKEKVLAKLKFLYS